MAPSENIEPADLKQQAVPRKRSFLRTLMYVGGNLILPILMAGAIVWAYNWLIETAPEAERGARQRRPRLAEFESVVVGDHDVKITAFGSVTPARMVDLKPRVSGAIDAIGDKFEPGGVFKKDAPLIWIDQERFRLAREIAAQQLVSAKEDIKALLGQVDVAKSALAVELGRAEVALQEYELMGIKVENKEKLDRLLRKPQLTQMRSALQSARARIAVAEAAEGVANLRFAQAKLDFERTIVKAPFNAIVIERLAELGDFAATASSLARICSTDAAWIEVTIPSGALSWIEIPDDSIPSGQEGSNRRADLIQTSRVIVYHDHSQGKGVTREARIVRLLPGRSMTGRQARLLLAVDDPFCLDAKADRESKLLLNSFVRVVITGRTLKSVVKMKRDVIHEGNVVWIADADDKLELRHVEPVWKSKDFVFVSSEQLKAGERLIVSVIPTPVPGLLLRPRPAHDPNADETKN